MCFQSNRCIIIIIIITTTTTTAVVIIESVGIRVPNRNLRDFISFSVDFKRRNCPSSGGPSTANAISRDVGIFNGKSVFNK